MVKNQKKKPVQEHREIFVLLRDIKSGKHQIVPRGTVVSTKKLDKLEPGDEISVGQRGSRSRGIILVIGSEDECKHSLAVIERSRQSKEKPNNKKNMDESEEESECGDTNDLHINDEDELTQANKNNNDGDDSGLVIDQEDSSVDNSHSSKRNSCTQGAGPMLASDQKLNSSSTTSKKRKESFDDEQAEDEKKRSRPSYIRSVPANVQATLQRQIDVLQAQVMEYQTTWMPRPTDQATVDYLIDIGKILGGGADTDDEEKGERLSEIMETLEMTEKELEKCKGRNIRITVRQIMRAKYPSPPAGFKFAEVNRDFVEAAREYSRLMHPREQKRFTDGELNHAMGNVFASQAHRQNTQQ